MREDWFDADGFRLHEIDGRLAAFCWTKIHVGEPGLPERAGEIYVIGVDPDFQGRGLGRQLTLAGLDAISAAGVADALLYVDAANESAVGLYAKLGFRTHRADHAYVRTVA
jgi:mycothiol synthase